MFGDSVSINERIISYYVLMVLGQLLVNVPADGLTDHVMLYAFSGTLHVLYVHVVQETAQNYVYMSSVNWH